ncbi:phosphate ABC transporter permease subunit PstC [SAR202 cluster bacterium AD-804-J14_MRT_500m]|nr:phosphate ABC transporter permease subunit PstC [SAR202 cluster bacterium AD-804-J14_MRT_500m]
MAVRERNFSRNQFPLSRSRRSRKLGEGTIHGVLLLCALISIITTVGIIVTLLTETVTFFRNVSFWEFLSGTQWTPNFIPQSFGVLPLVVGTLLVAVGASIVALPLGLATAIFLSEYSPDGLRRILKPMIEVLAGIPTVVYGFFALTFVTPHIIRVVNPDAAIFNVASAALVVGIMIIPMVSSLSEDAMVSVPRSLRDGAYALGANRLQVSLRIVVPAALSGIIAAFILAISRAIGETMIVTVAAGSIPNMTVNPFEGVQTMTAYIAQTSLGDTPQGTPEFLTIFAVGMTLFVMTFLLNVVANMVVRRYREEY